MGRVQRNNFTYYITHHSQKPSDFDNNREYLLLSNIYQIK